MNLIHVTTRNRAARWLELCNACEVISVNMAPVFRTGCIDFGSVTTL